MMTNHSTPTEPLESRCQALMPLLPPYSLGTASPDEARMVEALLPFCPDAQAALADYQHIRNALLTVVPLDETPPPVERLLARLHIRPTHHMPSMPVTPLPVQTHMSPHMGTRHTANEQVQPRRRVPPYARPAAPESRRRALWPGWIAICLLVIGFILTNLFWASQLNTLRREQQAFLETLTVRASDPPFASDAQYRALLPAEEIAQNANASFVWNSAEQIGALTVNGLPSLVAGQTYQLWLVRTDHTLSLGTFQLDSQGVGVLVFQAPEPIENFDHIGVNIEPVGGTATPTSPHLIIGNI